MKFLHELYKLPSLLSLKLLATINFPERARLIIRNKIPRLLMASPTR